jgi:hypothetical protein
MALENNNWYVQKLNEVKYATGTNLKNKGG